MIERIAHTTDFSEESAPAFLQALRLAVAARCRLDILHVQDDDDSHQWQSFPQVRQVLQHWGMLEAGATPADIEPRLGVHVAKIEIVDSDAERGLTRFLMSHLPDLLVIATHGRRGLNRWLHGSFSEEVARGTHIPTLLIGPHTVGIVDADTGRLSVRRVLVPVAPQPSPKPVLRVVRELLASIGETAAAIELMSVGHDLADVVDASGVAHRVERLDGRVVETILQEAERRKADLIAMPTAGEQGVLEMFRGSTTSRVIAEARCPVLSVSKP